MAKKKNKVGKAYKETKKGTGKVARFLNKEGKSYVKSAKKTLGLSAKKKKRLEPITNFLDVVFNPQGKVIRKGKKYFWEK